ncbi:MAG: YHS domain-containing (seleno)protein [Oceanipulchritudo sp.]
MKGLKDKLLLPVLLMTGVLLSAETKVLVHTDDNGVAVSGYDPVAFFEDGKPSKGHAKHRVVYQGALYFFVSRENQETFVAKPEKFEPRFGGYCPVSLAEESLKPGDPQNFRIVDGELYLLHDSEAAEEFRSERISFVQRFWDKQVEENGLVYAPARSSP